MRCSAVGCSRSGVEGASVAFACAVAAAVLPPAGATDSICVSIGARSTTISPALVVAGGVAGVVRRDRSDQRGSVEATVSGPMSSPGDGRRLLRAEEREAGGRASRAPNVRGARGPWNRADGTCWLLDRPGLPKPADR